PPSSSPPAIFRPNSSTSSTPEVYRRLYAKCDPRIQGFFAPHAPTTGPNDVDATSTSHEQHGWDIHALSAGGRGVPRVTAACGSTGTPRAGPGAGRPGRGRRGSEAVLGAVEGLAGRGRDEVHRHVVVGEVEPPAAARVEAEELGLGGHR